MTKQEIENRISELENEIKELKKQLHKTVGYNRTFEEQAKRVWMISVKNKYRDYKGHSVSYYWWPKIRAAACAAATNGRTTLVKELHGDEIDVAVKIASERLDEFLKEIGVE